MYTIIVAPSDVEVLKERGFWNFITDFVYNKIYDILCDFNEVKKQIILINVNFYLFILYFVLFVYEKLCIIENVFFLH